MNVTLISKELQVTNSSGHLRSAFSSSCHKKMSTLMMDTEVSTWEIWSQSHYKKVCDLQHES